MNQENINPEVLPEVLPDLPPDDIIVEPTAMVTTMRLLVRRDKTTGEIESTQMLFDDIDTEHIIIDNLPVIEDKPGFTGHYIVATDKTVSIEYREIPKSAEEIQNEINAALMLEIAQLKSQISNNDPAQGV